jgi:8-oxo-dGTP diphosphatase
MWDFPGGRRDGDETPAECVIRETFEEFSIRLSPTEICYQCMWLSTQVLAGEVYFLAAHLTEEQVQGIKFGDEGQCWDFIPISSVSVHPGFIPHLQTRFEACIRALSTERRVAAAPGLAMSNSEPVTDG